MKEKKDIPGVELPEGIAWFNPEELSPESQMKILSLTFKEPLGSYKSDFRCLGNQRTYCGKQAQTKNCVMRGFCYFLQRYYPIFAYRSTGNDDGLTGHRKEFWRRSLDDMWRLFMRRFVLWKWAILFYHKDGDKEAMEQVNSLLSQKMESALLLHLDAIVDKLQEGRIKINLGERRPWHEEEQLLHLTIDKGFIFGVEGGEGKKLHTEIQLHNHNVVSFLMAMRNFGLKVNEGQLTSHSLSWFFLMDTGDQSGWIYNVLSEVRRTPAKLLWYERRHELGPALRYLRNNLTTEAAYLTTLCFHASEGFLEGPVQEEFSFEVLNRVYELEKLAREGRTFWEGWKDILSRHIGDVFSGLIHYVPRDKKLPISPEQWFDVLKPHKQSFWNFLFFLKEDEKETVLKLIDWELEFLKKHNHLAADGAIQERPKLPAYDYGGLKDSLKNLAKAVFN